MKFGVRKLSFKKSFKARTTGKAKRTLKRSINPLYGKKGMGWVNNPRKAAYNKVYNKTSISARKLDSTSKRRKKSTGNETASGCGSGCGCLIFILVIILLSLI
ncbi:hypothetical protein ACF3NG_02755 [Aerococcaceae bacterium WGS1372]